VFKYFRPNESVRNVEVVQACST